MFHSRNWPVLAVSLLLPWLLPQGGVGQAAPSPSAQAAAPAKQQQPKLIYSVDPAYTELARTKKVAGTCVFALKVAVDGKRMMWS